MQPGLVHDAGGRDLHQHRSPHDDEETQGGEVQRQAAVQRIAGGTAQGRAAAHAVAARVGLEFRHDLEQAAAHAFAKLRLVHDCSRLARPSVSSATASLVAATWPATLGDGAGLTMRKLRAAERFGRLKSTAAWATSPSQPEASKSRPSMLTPTPPL